MRHSSLKESKKRTQPISPVRQVLTIVFIMVVTISFAAAQGVLQTQESDLYDGISVDLTKLAVKNNIITIKMKWRNEGDEKHSVRFSYGNCYIMDSANQKKYFALKDSEGIFIAGPQHDKDKGGRFWYEIKQKKSKNIWIKFPLPTDNPETISIAIPGVSPFDDVELKK
ncbi:MAG: hypothetical protein GY757_50905 [bacterium]|nr:hypothetical protein [bacterium]